MSIGRTTSTLKGDALYTEAAQLTPGGGAATVRYNRALGKTMYFSGGDGAYVTDVDGIRYLDMCMSHGASILGHNHPKLKAAVAEALEMGIICSYETEHHVSLARKMTEMVPGAEMVRFSGTGTETVMHALRLARASTGRNKFIKFEGHFHGYSDYVYWSTAPPVGSAGPADKPTPFCQSDGIPDAIADYLVVVPFNDLPALQAAVEAHREDLAGIIMEPVNYDAGCILPGSGYLESIRELATNNDVLLIFDEVLTAFRIAPGGAQEYFGVIPDLAILGKATGGGLPLSAIAGKKAVMSHLRPLGNAEHSGTYMGHLIPVAGSLACLDELSKPGVFEHLFALGDRLYEGIRSAVARCGIRARLQHLGPRFFIYFGLDPEVEVVDYRSAAQYDREMTLAFSREMMARGLYFHDYGGGLAHHGFSTAHTVDDIDLALGAIEDSLKVLS
ncbi:MAG: aspartate aminotransferase family protein [Gemmatimonadetes bacterium]|nr:aspartate aminotransferase family protein [Gemmatimonadota bacterium]